MRIRIFVKDMDTDEVLEELGTCLTDSPNRAIQMYDQDEAWAEKGYNANICWEDITDKAAQALGKRGGEAKTEAKKASSAENGKLGGRPKKVAPHS